MPPVRLHGEHDSIESVRREKRFDLMKIGQVDDLALDSVALRRQRPPHVVIGVETCHHHRDSGPG